eukprot:PLAT3302.36.p1 GENE.PLAT3302.36~~PLAT3302.36.p1  ORF type:complete len:2805 (-),score=1679.31 PLAT3302.36:87-8501(-)
MERYCSSMSPPPRPLLPLPPPPTPPPPPPQKIAPSRIRITLSEPSKTSEDGGGGGDGGSDGGSDGAAAAGSDKPSQFWLVLDGPMSHATQDMLAPTLLSRALALESCELLALPDDLRLLFEVDSLAAASPTFAAHVTVIAFPPGVISWRQLLTPWIASLPSAVPAACREAASAMLTALLPGCEAFLRDAPREARTLALPTYSAINMVFNLIDCCLWDSWDRGELRSRRVAHPPSHAFGDVISLMTLQLQRALLFAITWGIGGQLAPAGRERFNTWLRARLEEVEEQQHVSLLELVPEGTDSLFDVGFDAVVRKLRPWADMSPAFSPDSTLASGGRLLVATPTTTCMSILSHRLLVGGFPLLLHGQAGVGKTSTLLHMLASATEFDSHRLPLTTGTTADQMRRCVLALLERRQRNVYGPRDGRRIVLMLDDVNLPAPETEDGAFDGPSTRRRQALQLLRQLIDKSGWHRTATAEFSELRDLRFGCTAGDTGRRHPLPPRLARHLNVLHKRMPTEEELETIFAPLVSSHLENHAHKALWPLKEPLLAATLALYSAVSAQMQPSPATPLHVFTPRDVASIFRGIFAVPANTLGSEESALVGLWAHETARVLGDRLSTAADRAWLRLETQKQARRFFPSADLRQLDSVMTTVCYSQYASKADKYLHMKDPGTTVRLVNELLHDLALEQLSPPPVLDDPEVATEQVGRLARLLAFPATHVLLVGSSSQLPLMAELGIMAAGHAKHELAITPSFDRAAWEASLKLMLKACALDNRALVFLLREQHMQLPFIMDDLHLLVTCGDVPRLWDREDKELVQEELSVHIVRLGMPATTESAFQLFVERVRRNLHLLICVGPESSAWEQVVTEHPSLVTGCAINWVPQRSQGELAHLAQMQLTRLATLGELTGEVAAGGDDVTAPAAPRRPHSAGGSSASAASPGGRRAGAPPALVVSSAGDSGSGGGGGGVVGARPVVSFTTTSTLPSAPMRGADSESLAATLSTVMCRFHLVAEELAADLPPASVPGDDCCGPTSGKADDSAAGVGGRLGQRQVYTVSDDNFMLMLSQFKKLLASRHASLDASLKSTSHAVQILHSVQAEVRAMQTRVSTLESSLDAATRRRSPLQQAIDSKKVEAEKFRLLIERETAEAAAESERVDRETARCARLLADAMPTMVAARKQLRGMTKSDVLELKTVPRPSKRLTAVVEALCILKEITPRTATDASGRKKLDYWPEAAILLSDPKFVAHLQDFDARHLPESVVRQLTVYVGEEDFLLTKHDNVPRLARVISLWVLAQHKNYLAQAIIIPEQQQLEEDAARLKTTMLGLEVKRDTLKALEKSIATMSREYEHAVEQKKNLTREIMETQARAERGRKLATHFADCLASWRSELQVLKDARAHIVGETLLIAGMIAYAGPLPPAARRQLAAAMREELAAAEVSLSDAAGLPQLLARNQELEWRVNGLPRSSFATENAVLIMSHDLPGWPFILDPHGLARRWLHSQEAHDRADWPVQLQYDDASLIEELVRCLQSGHPTVVENVPPQPDGMLLNLLQWRVRLVEGRNVIQLGDRLVEVDPGFRIYFLCPHSSPPLPAWLQASMRVVSFCEPSALEERLLSAVVHRERRGIEDNMRTIEAEMLKLTDNALRIEADLLSHLSAVVGDELLSREDALKRLHSLRSSLDVIKEQMAERSRVQRHLAPSREPYRALTARVASLYSVLLAFRSVAPTCHMSINWFTEQLLSSLRAAPKAMEEELRLDAIFSHFVRSVHAGVRSALPPRHHQLFSLLLAARVETEDSDSGRMQLAYLLAPEPAAAADDDGFPGGAGLSTVSKLRSVLRSSLIGLDGEEEKKDDDEADSTPPPSGASSGDDKALLSPEAGPPAAVRRRRSMDKRHSGRSATSSLSTLVAPPLGDGDSLTGESMDSTSDYSAAGELMTQPSGHWASPQVWARVHTLSRFPAFAGLLASFAQPGWESFFQHSTPEQIVRRDSRHRRMLPGYWATKVTPWMGLLLLRALRPDRLLRGVTELVKAVLGGGGAAASRSPVPVATLTTASHGTPSGRRSGGRLSGRSSRGAGSRSSARHSVSPAGTATGSSMTHSALSGAGWMGLSTAFQQSSVARPVLLVVPPDAGDPATLVRQLGDRVGRSLAEVCCGRADRSAIESAVVRASSRGNWVMVHNAHLDASWLASETLLKRVRSSKVMAHSDFRMWLTVPSSAALPEPLLWQCLKLWLQPPRSQREHLMQLLPMLERVLAAAAVDLDEEEAELGELAHTLYKLAQLHTMLVSRAQYGALGWTAPTQFSDATLVRGLEHVVATAHALDVTRVDSLFTLMVEVYYACAVHSDKDLRTLRVLAADVLADLAQLGGSELAAYRVPKLASWPAYAVATAAMPELEPAQLLGMAAPYGTLREQVVTLRLLGRASDVLLKRPLQATDVDALCLSVTGRRSPLLAQMLAEAQARELPVRGGLVSPSAPSARQMALAREEVEWSQLEDRLADTVGELLELLPQQAPVPPPTDGSSSPLVTLLRAECEAHGRLISTVQRQLQQLEDDGLNMALLPLAAQLLAGRVPEEWQALSHLPAEPVLTWAAAVQRSVAFVQHWRQHGLPTVMWLPALYNPAGFISAALQQHAQKHLVPVERLRMTYEVTALPSSDAVPDGQPGSFISGLALLGARWDGVDAELLEPMARSLYDAMPLLQLKPALLGEEEIAAEGTAGGVAVDASAAPRSAEKKAAAAAAAAASAAAYPCPLLQRQPPLALGAADAREAVLQAQPVLGVVHLPTHDGITHWVARGTLLCVTAAVPGADVGDVASDDGDDE